jgi:hypothetical protein
VNLAANSITSIIGASIAGIGSRATGRIAGTGMMTVAGGFGNGSGFPTSNNVSILTRVPKEPSDRLWWSGSAVAVDHIRLAIRDRFAIAYTAPDLTHHRKRTLATTR